MNPVTVPKTLLARMENLSRRRTGPSSFEQPEHTWGSHSLGGRLEVNNEVPTSPVANSKSSFEVGNDQSAMPQSGSDQQQLSGSVQSIQLTKYYDKVKYLRAKLEQLKDTENHDSFVGTPHSSDDENDCNFDEERFLSRERNEEREIIQDQLHQTNMKIWRLTKEIESRQKKRCNHDWFLSWVRLFSSDKQFKQGQHPVRLYCPVDENQIIWITPKQYLDYNRLYANANQGQKYTNSISDVASHYLLQLDQASEYTLCCLSRKYCRCSNLPLCENCGIIRAPSMTYCYNCSPTVARQKDWVTGKVLDKKVKAAANKKIGHPLQGEINLMTNFMNRQVRGDELDTPQQPQIPKLAIQQQFDDNKMEEEVTPPPPPRSLVPPPPPIRVNLNPQAAFDPIHITMFHPIDQVTSSKITTVSKPLRRRITSEDYQVEDIVMEDDTSLKTNEVRTSLLEPNTTNNLKIEVWVTRLDKTVLIVNASITDDVLGAIISANNDKYMKLSMHPKIYLPVSFTSDRLLQHIKYNPDTPFLLYEHLRLPGGMLTNRHPQQKYIVSPRITKDRIKKYSFRRHYEIGVKFLPTPNVNNLIVMPIMLILFLILYHHDYTQLMIYMRGATTLVFLALCAFLLSIQPIYLFLDDLAILITSFEATFINVYQLSYIIIRAFSTLYANQYFSNPNAAVVLQTISHYMPYTFIFLILHVIIIYNSRYEDIEELRRVEVNHQKVFSKDTVVQVGPVTENLTQTLDYLDLGEATKYFNLERDKDIFDHLDNGKIEAVCEDGAPVFFTTVNNMMMLPNLTKLEFNVNRYTTEIYFKDTNQLKHFPSFIGKPLTFMYGNGNVQVYSHTTMHTFSSFLTALNAREASENWCSLKVSFLDTLNNDNELIIYANKKWVIVCNGTETLQASTNIVKSLYIKYLAMSADAKSFPAQHQQVRAAISDNECGAPDAANHVASILVMCNFQINHHRFQDEFRHIWKETGIMKKDSDAKIPLSSWTDLIDEYMIKGSKARASIPKLTSACVFPITHKGFCINNLRPQVVPNLKPYSYVKKNLGSCIECKSVAIETSPNYVGKKIFANSCIHNMTDAFVRRNASDFVKLKGKNLLNNGALLMFTQMLVNSHFSGGIINKVMHEEVWLNRFAEKGKRDKYYEVYKKQANGELGDLKCQTSIFTKMEWILGKGSKWSPEDDPSLKSRIIYKFCEEYQLNQGPFAHLISEAMCATYGGYQSHYYFGPQVRGIFYTGHYNANTLGDLIYDITILKLNNLFWARQGDQQSYDSHQRAIHQAVQYSLWKKLLDKYDPSVLNNYWLQYQKIIFGKSKYDTLKAYLEGIMASGSNRTSTDNFFLNLCMNLLELWIQYGNDVWAMLGVHLFYIGFGDDNETFGSGILPAPNPQASTQIMSMMQMEAKFDFVTQVYDLKYCSKVFVPAIEPDTGDKTFLATQLIGNNLQKAYSTFHNYNSEQIEHFNKQVSDLYMQNSHHIEWLYKRHELVHKKFQNAVKPKNPIKIDVAEHTMKQLDHQLNVSDELPAWFEGRYGFDMNILEEQFNQCTYDQLYDLLNTSDYTSYFDIIVARDCGDKIFRIPELSQPPKTTDSLTIEKLKTINANFTQRFNSIKWLPKSAITIDLVDATYVADHTEPQNENFNDIQPVNTTEFSYPDLLDDDLEAAIMATGSGRMKMKIKRPRPPKDSNDYYMNWPEGRSTNDDDDDHQEDDDDDSEHNDDYNDNKHRMKLPFKKQQTHRTKTTGKFSARGARHKIDGQLGVDPKLKQTYLDKIKQNPVRPPIIKNKDALAQFITTPPLTNATNSSGSSTVAPPIKQPDQPLKKKELTLEEKIAELQKTALTFNSVYFQSKKPILTAVTADSDVEDDDDSDEKSSIVEMSADKPKRPPIKRIIENKLSAIKTKIQELASKPNKTILDSESSSEEKEEPEADHVAFITDDPEYGYTTTDAEEDEDEVNSIDEIERLYQEELTANLLEKENKEIDDIKNPHEVKEEIKNSAGDVKWSNNFTEYVGRVPGTEEIIELNEQQNLDVTNGFPIVKDGKVLIISTLQGEVLGMDYIRKDIIPDKMIKKVENAQRVDDAYIASKAKKKRKEPSVEPPPQPPSTKTMTPLEVGSKGSIN